MISVAFLLLPGLGLALSMVSYYRDLNVSVAETLKGADPI